MPPPGSGDRPLRVAVVGAGLYATEALLKNRTSSSRSTSSTASRRRSGCSATGRPRPPVDQGGGPGAGADPGRSPGAAVRERHLQGRPPPPGPQAPLRPDRLRRWRPGRPAHEHPRRGPAQQPPGHLVRRLVQRPSRLPRAARRSHLRAGGGGRQRQRGHGRGPHPGHRPRRAGHDRHRRPRPGGVAGQPGPRGRGPGRRGAAQASCTTPELKELGKLDGVGVVVDPANVELARASRTVVEEDRTARANLKILREYAARDPPRRPAPHRPALPVLGRPSSSGAAAASPACGSSATSWSRTPRAGSGPRARASST